MAQKYIIRLDDFSEYRNVEKWDRIELLLDKYDIKPLVGVIPACKEETLMDEGYRNDLWEKVKDFENKEWTIAIHGYTHEYREGDFSKPEFLDISYGEACKRLTASFSRFSEHGVIPKTFFAPAHGFDKTTIKALLDVTPIRWISDGYASLPYKYGGVVFVPAQTSYVKKMPYYKLVTFVYHPNTMCEDDFLNLEKFFIENHDSFVKFPLIETSHKKNIVDVLYYALLVSSRKGRMFAITIRDRVKAHSHIIYENGLGIYIRGVLRRNYYKKLQKKYGFNMWHIVPYELRPYARYLINFINRDLHPTSVVEFGCGLGDILRNLKAKTRIGIDLSNEVIECAKALDRNGGCTFSQGELGWNSGLPENIDIVLSVNFTHGISENELIVLFNNILEKIRVKSKKRRGALL